MNNNKDNLLKPKGYDEVTVWERKTLPVDGYVCLIVKAALQKSSNGNDMLVLYLDIAEGKYKGYYTDLFKSADEQHKKWKGKFHLILPKPTDYSNNREQYDRATKNYKRLITCIENSNKGFEFKFNTEQLKNKLVGFEFAEEEWEWNGKSGFTVKPRFPRSAESIRSGDFKLSTTTPKASNPKKSQSVDFELPTFDGTPQNDSEDDEDIPPFDPEIGF
jgi:hypothetical protein